MKSFFKSFKYKNISFDATIVTLIGFSGFLVIGEAYQRTSLSDAQSATDCQYPPVSEILTSYHVRALEENNIVVIHNVLSPSQLEGARQSAQKLSATMARLNHSNDNSIRQDEICLVREDRSTEIGDDMIHCIKLLRGLPFILSLLRYTASSSFVIPRQCQLAKYKPDGSIYVRHLDRCTSTLLDMGLMEWLRASDYRHRTLTAILYLNSPEWTDGGNLRCFGEDGSKIDINPTGGTLVIFDSSRVEHQVLPSSMDRFALTLWINGVMNS